MSSLHKVHLFDQTYELVGNTVAEVLEGLTRQLPELQPDPFTGRKVIGVEGFDTIESLYQNLEPEQELFVFPVFEGDKSKFTQVLVGAALIAVGLFSPLNAMTVANGAVNVGKYVAQMGFMMLLGGVAQMLAPVPEVDKNEGSSKYLGTPRNTVQIGTRIPILYGEYRWGGHYLSFDINASNQ